MHEIATLGVCGAGTMGHGIAQVGAMAGLEVWLMDTEQAALDRALGLIRESLARLANKGKLDDAGVDAVLSRLSVTTKLEQMAAAADVVIEAVPEALELKREVFVSLDRSAPPRTILATNTSQFSITAIAAATTRPDRVIGLHWFSPAVLTRLVEVVRGLETSDETLDRALSLVARLGKETIVCRRDSPGFVTTRLIAVLTNEAQRIVEEGLATVAEVDKACRLAFGHPMGPFETADLTGLDVQLMVRRALCEAHGERFRPTNLLRQHVDAGRLGRKSGKGFYDHGSGS